MNKKLLFLLWGISLLCTAIAQKVTTLRINPDDALGGTVSQIFDSVRYIPLETTKEIEIGDVENVQVSEHYITFFSHDSKCLYVFTKIGQLVSKIDALPLALGGKRLNGYYLGNYVLDNKNQLLYVRYNDVDRKPRIGVFTPEGKVRESILLPDFFKELSEVFVILNDSVTVFSSKKLGHKNDYFFKIVKNFKEIETSLVPADTSDILIQKDIANYYKTYKLSDGKLWNRVYDYTFYEIGNDRKAVVSRFLFPVKNTIDTAFYTLLPTLESSMSDIEYFSGKEQVCRLPFLCKEGKYMAFTLYRNVNESYRNNTFFYSVSSGRLFSLDRISPDSSNYFMPIANSIINTLHGRYVYTVVPAFKFFEYKNSSERENWKTNDVLRHFLETGDRKSNPVIVELKLKENL